MVPLSAATRKRLDTLFAPADRAAAARLLEEECGNNLPFCEAASPESSERIRHAALKLSGGDLAELRSMVAHAQLDWRDVLVSAGFGSDLDAHRRWQP